MQQLRRRKSLEDVLYDEEFWQEQRAAVMKVALPMFREIFLEGAEVAADVTPVRQKVALPTDPDAVNSAADIVLQNFSNEWWQRLDRTQRDGLRNAIALARQEGTGVEGVLAAIDGLFSESRIMAIAVTETTRLFGMGALATYRAAGMDGWQWMTVNDSRVDPICEGLNGEQFPISKDFEPAHVSCRCYPAPVFLS